MGGNSELPRIEHEGPAPVPSMRAAILGSLIAAIIAVVLFSWLADEVFEGGARHFDDSIRAWVHQFASPALTRAMIAISHVGSEVLAAVIIMAAATFLSLKWTRAAVWLLLATAGGLLLEFALKSAFHRARPAAFFGVAPHSYSFPSGHALMSLCVYGTLAGVLSVRIRSAGARVLAWGAAAALILAIGASRIYLGVHYPSDVLAGYLAAALWVSTLIAADRVRKRKRLRGGDAK